MCYRSMRDALHVWVRQANYHYDNVVRHTSYHADNVVCVTHELRGYLVCNIVHYVCEYMKQSTMLTA